MRQKRYQAKCYVVHSPLRQLTIGSNRQCTLTQTSTTLIWSTPWAKSALTIKQLLCPNTWKHFLHDPLHNLHSKQAWHHDQQQFVLWQSNVCSQQNKKQLHSRVKLPQRQLAAASGIETCVNHETHAKINLARTCVPIFGADQRCTHYISKRDRRTRHQHAHLMLIRQVFPVDIGDIAKRSDQIRLDHSIIKILTFGSVHWRGIWISCFCAI